MDGFSRWPQLRYDDWKETLDALHLWTQIVGKIRLRHEPFVNHYWHVTLYVTSRGLSTSAMPCRDGRTFEIAFDFLDHLLRIDDCDGAHADFPLEPMSVADFYRLTMGALRDLDIPVAITTMPNEIPDARSFDRDVSVRPYDKIYVERFWRVLLQVDRLCKIFRSAYIGKASPVHFFWGSFDIAATRFSGRPAPPHPGGIPNLPDDVTRESYSCEEHSVGFWPGGFGHDALFYAYAYPSPLNFERSIIKPDAATWNDQLKEFVLPYETVRMSADPDRNVLDFFATTFEAAAKLANWDRAALVRQPPG